MNIYYLFFILITAIQLTYEQVAKECEIVSSFYGNDLKLYSNNLDGSIPPELGELSELIELNLSGNKLSGSIPPELGNLTNLQELVLENNNLSGSVPTEFGKLENLQKIFLKGNDICNIPPELNNLSTM
ncbi:L domain-like protein [Neocallimastix lanati (nom. inval.)]|uniref:L domain-like protein n=1 Tax=Neocallimastix californiae TaxID=1754190 RepID=A0A1Y2DMI8_9FUNG|nr:L domain-like protein [Neocallimastix sp. JGI-2020a]ORY60364.1 L domain-like protein [Neocallimastix californiae]|eukprot:ORY60364.1 L domain-like protein [Neocallimastix californiae]